MGGFAQDESFGYHTKSKLGVKIDLKSNYKSSAFFIQFLS